MIDRKSIPSLKAVVVGALAGAATFFALSAVRAQAVLTVAQVRSNPKAYVATGIVQVTGLVSGVRTDTRRINGEDVPVIKLNLYEQDSKGRRGSHYVYVVVPANQFSSLPVEGGMATITGPLKWPYEVAAIDP